MISSLISLEMISKGFSSSKTNDTSSLLLTMKEGFKIAFPFTLTFPSLIALII